MTDPVIEAVRRSISPAAGPAERQAALDAAREALRPIREWYEDDNAPWPAILPLIYSSKELGR
ncbi:hypothetical protein [Mycolicibacterium goodii]|uniref:hypothetical protein n=1 Tax=Mycolicibacterium goodii TaxID=134601 RepID=UPI001BDD7A68|nr:hypothetical protein [Mycolicibacterium goodii]MBU8834413.1 hypothetical protein [Mycolicibacterium goodii]